MHVYLHIARTLYINSLADWNSLTMTFLNVRQANSCVTTKRDGKAAKKEGKHQKRNSSQHHKERNNPNSSENEEIEAQQEPRGTE